MLLCGKTMEHCNSWMYRNAFITVDYLWLGKDFHKHYSVIKPEPCLNLGNAISKEYRMFCQILKSNFIFQRLQKTLHPDSFHIC